MVRVQARLRTDTEETPRVVSEFGDVVAGIGCGGDQIVDRVCRLGGLPDRVVEFVETGETLYLDAVVVFIIGKLGLEFERLGRRDLRKTTEIVEFEGGFVPSGIGYRVDVADWLSRIVGKFFEGNSEPSHCQNRPS